MDRISRICLVLIVALLATIALRPLYTPERVHAAAARSSYKMQFINQHEAEGAHDCKYDEESMRAVNADSAQGWEAVAISQQSNPRNGCAVYSVLEKR